MKPERDARLADLLRRAIDGDEASYAAFLREVSRFLRGSITRSVAAGSPIDPEDIVQETLLAIHLKRHTWRPDLPVGPWMRAIARYKTIDAFRRRGSRIEVDIAAFEESLAADEAESASERDIRRALDGLSAGQRQVVAAISVEGCTVAEAAARFGMKETAVRVALHRGLTAIAARFGNASR